MRFVPQRTSRSGFTLLEIMMAVALLAIVVVKAHGAIGDVNQSLSQQTREIVLEDHARRVLRRIGYEIMGSNRDSLIPVSNAPLSSDDLLYQVNLGIHDGEVVWSDQEEVALQELEGQISWSESPGTPEERRVIWTSLVAPYLEGEIPNGMDDNGNGLIDERGLSFVIDRNSVTVRLTLERQLPGGGVVTQTVQTTVTCRNLTPST
ncbi:MAG: prepilin-type N-terminal cleavage/methylation domain-containing protein [Chlamydiales bacterium]|jgi:prepilin-type N-terminal cleavage/methylation domain-containing protein